MFQVKWALWQQEPPNPLLWDVQLVADDGEKVHASRSDLAAWSPYFRSLFGCTDFSDAQSNQLPIRDMNSSVLRDLVRSMYSGELPLDEDEHVAALLEGADRLQVDSAKAECCRILAERLSPSTAIATYLTADCHSCKELRTNAAKLIASHLADVVKEAPCTQLRRLKCDDLACVLRNASADVRCSTAPLDLVQAMDKHEAERKDLVDMVLEAVPVLKGCPADLVAYCRHPLVAAKPAFLLRALEAMSHKAPAYELGHMPIFTYTESEGCKQAACWRIDRWSKRQMEEELISPGFCVPGVSGGQWHLRCYPTENCDGKGTHVSLYLHSTDDLQEPVSLAYQLFVVDLHEPTSALVNLFSGPTQFTAAKGFGFPQLVSIDTMAARGVSDDDTVMMGVNVKVLSN